MNLTSNGVVGSCSLPKAWDLAAAMRAGFWKLYHHFQAGHSPPRVQTDHSTGEVLAIRLTQLSPENERHAWEAQEEVQGV